MPSDYNSDSAQGILGRRLMVIYSESRAKQHDSELVFFTVVERWVTWLVCLLLCSITDQKKLPDVFVLFFASLCDLFLFRVMWSSVVDCCLFFHEMFLAEVCLLCVAAAGLLLLAALKNIRDLLSSKLHCEVKMFRLWVRFPLDPLVVLLRRFGWKRNQKAAISAFTGISTQTHCNRQTDVNTLETEL